MAKYGAKEVMDVTVYDLTTGKPVLYLDTLKMSGLENAADSSDARGGKGNPKLLSWEFNRTANLKLQDALMSMKSFALMAGTAVTEGSADLYAREECIVDGSQQVTLSNTPKAGAVITIYKADEGEDGVEQTVGVPATTVNTYSITGRTITFNATSCPQYTVVYVYYIHTVADTTTLTIESDSFPGFYRIVGDTVIRNNSTGVDEDFQVIVDKCKFKSGFTMSFSAEGDPSTFDMEVEVFRIADGTDMVRLVKY